MDEISHELHFDNRVVKLFRKGIKLFGMFSKKIQKKILKILLSQIMIKNLLINKLMILF